MDSSTKTYTKSPKTLEAYKNMLALLQDSSRGIPNFDLLNADKNIQWILNEKKPNGSNYSNAYRKNLLNALIHYTKGKNETAYKKYYTKMMELKKFQDVHQESQKLTETQQKNDVTFSEILRVRDTLPKDSEEYVLLSLYTTEGMPPIRADYSPMRVFQRKTDVKKYNKNYMIINRRHCELHLVEYKTSASCGTIVHTMPKSLCGILRKWRAVHTGNWLFETRSGEPYTESYLSQKITSIFKKAINKNVGITMIRIAYLTEKGKHDRTILEKKETAKLMGHCISTGETYAKK